MNKGPTLIAARFEVGSPSMRAIPYPVTTRLTGFQKKKQLTAAHKIRKNMPCRKAGVVLIRQYLWRMPVSEKMLILSFLFLFPIGNKRPQQIAMPAPVSDRKSGRSPSTAKSNTIINNKAA